MSTDLEGVPRINLGAFRTHFPDLANLMDEMDIELPKIIVAGHRTESAASKLIETLFGFSVCLKEINHPVEYHFIRDKSCRDNEAFCRVGKCLVEIDLATECETTVVDRLIELNDWEDDYPGLHPLVLEIRANCVPNMAVIDSYCDPFDEEEEDELNPFTHVKGSPRIVVIEVAHNGCLQTHEYRRSVIRIRLELPVGSPPIEDSIPKIRKAIFRSILGHAEIKRIVNEIHKRLGELDGPIPETDNGKQRLLCNMVEAFKKTIEEDLDSNSVCKSTFSQMKIICPLVNDPLRSMEGMMLQFRTICDKTAEYHFSRFPPIVSELKKLSTALLDNTIAPHLKQTIDLVSEPHFVLAHEFLCLSKPNCEGACGNEILAKAFIGPVINRMRHTLIARVKSQLYSWISLLEEPEAITNERNQLRKKMKLIHNLNASSAFYNGKLRCN